MIIFATMKKRFLLPAFCLLLMLNSCKKGCTDENAVNFESKAKKDNLSCKYEATVLFWLNPQSALNLSSNAGNYSSTMSCYLNGILVGSVNIDDVKSAAQPDCNSATPLKTTKQLGKNSSGIFSYKIVTDKGIVIQDEVNVLGNSCNPVEIVF